MAPSSSTYDPLKRLLLEHINKSMELLTQDSSMRQQDTRSFFQREYDRVIFSDYFRSMSTKTQVVPSPDNDHTHTRLTHSLEVAALGFDFGKKLANDLLAGENKRYYGGESLGPIEREARETLNNLPLIIATACLVHDIGNPPFGHTGEEAIQLYFARHWEADGNYKKFHLTPEQLNDFTYFDGNAYGLRVLTRLAGRRPFEAPSERTAKTGLGFSPVTLLTFTKYPFASGQYPGKANKKKFGFLQAEQTLFNDVLASVDWPLGKRHPLAYLVEAADDICYFIMDCEDAIKNGHLSFAEINRYFQVKAYVKRRSELDPDLFPKREVAIIEEAIDTIERFDKNKPILPKELKALEAIRAFMFRDFVSEAYKIYKVLIADITTKDDLSFNVFDQLMINLRRKKEYDQFKRERLDNSLYCHTRKMTMELSGSKVISDLLERCLDALSEYKAANYDFHAVSTQTRHLLRFVGLIENECLDDYQLILRALDFIIQHSDRDLIKLHKELNDFSFI